MLERLARFCYRRRWLVLIVWIVALVGISAVGGKAKGAYQTDFKLPSTESWQAFSLLSDRFPSQAGAEARIVYRTRDVMDPSVRSAFEAFFTELRGMKHVVDVTSPYDSPIPTISKDHTIAFAMVAFDSNGPDLDRDAVIAVKHRVEAFEVPGVEIALGGQAVRFAEQQGPGNGGVAIIAAILILLITFGSVIAMGLPILTAIFGLGIGLALVGLLARVIAVPEFTPELAAMIGLGVGIDYALFIVTRYRQTLHAGHDPETSVVVAITTSGRAVIFAGITVVISLMGMLFMGLAFVRGVAFGAALAVFITMIASITLLPSVLGFCGHAIDRLRVPFLHRDESEHRTSIWFRWSRVVQRRPVQAGVAGAAVLVLVALPVLSLQLGFADEGNDKPGSGTRRAYEMTAEGFGPGYNGPLILASPLERPIQRVALNRLALTLRDTPGVDLAAPPRLSPNRDAAVIFLVPTSSPQSHDTRELIDRLRTQVLPQALGPGDPPVYVGGITALFDDLSGVMLDRLPFFIGGVVILSFLLLMVVFRSLVIPLKAAIVNLLGIAAAYGVVIAIFQWGRGGSLFGVQPAPIEAFLPMMLFAIVFGLSMDYEVFLMSRIREEYLKERRNDIAVADGLATTARVITAAAAIMVTLFLSFVVLGDERVIKLFGLGLAVAVFLDATLIRMVIVPSFMELFGDANWWLPRWLDRIMPNISIDAPSVALVSETTLEDAPAPVATPPTQQKAKTNGSRARAKAKAKPKPKSGAKLKAKTKPAPKGRAPR